jgi:hypothetical protein
MCNVFHCLEQWVIGGTNPIRGADTQLGDDVDVDRAMGNVMPCEWRIWLFRTKVTSHSLFFTELCVSVSFHAGSSLQCISGAYSLQRTGRERVCRRIEQARTLSWTCSRSQIPHYLGRWCEENDQESTWRTRGYFPGPFQISSIRIHGTCSRIPGPFRKVEKQNLEYAQSQAKLNLEPRKWITERNPSTIFYRLYLQLIRRCPYSETFECDFSGTIYGRMYALSTPGKNIC